MAEKQLRLKGVKIVETFDDFMQDHPELKFVRDEDGDIINIAPAKKGVDIISQTIICNQPKQVVFKYKGEKFAFPKTTY